MNSISNIQKTPRSQSDRDRQRNNIVSLDASKLQLDKNSEIKVYDSTGKAITLSTPIKALEILERDLHCCRGCGKRNCSTICRLDNVGDKIPKERSPKIFLVTVCDDCRKRLETLSQGGVSTSPDDDFEFWSKFYHEGIYRADQDLSYIKSFQV